jgi:hypothetical protein
MTLMACYGGPAWIDDCVDGDGDGWFPTCYDEPCDPEVDPNCDCDDGRADIHPGAPDVFGDGLDSDCSGADGPGKRRTDPTPASTPRRTRGSTRRRDPARGAGQRGGRNATAQTSARLAGRWIAWTSAKPAVVRRWSKVGRVRRTA